LEALLHVLDARSRGMLLELVASDESSEPCGSPFRRQVDQFWSAADVASVLL